MILIFILGLVALRILYSVGEVCYERDWPRDTWKGLLIALGVLCIAVSAFGQAARVDLPLLTAGPSVPISGGPLPQALWVANAAAYLCTHPSATLVACQAAPITTYTDSTEGTTCPTATPLVQLPGNTCTASTGTAANVGFWYGGGLFDYWIVSSYGTYGPFSGNSSNSALPSSCGNPIGIPCGGTGAPTAAGALANLLAPIQVVNNFSGTTASEKVTACLAAAGNGGICDATGFVGPQVIDSCIEVGPGGISQTLRANVNAPFVLSSKTACGIKIDRNGQLIDATINVSPSLAYTGDALDVEDVIDSADNTFSIKNVTVNGDGTGITAYSGAANVYTLTMNNSFTAGQPVTFWVLSGPTALNKLTLNVSATGLSSTSFQVPFTGASGSGTAQGMATAGGFCLYMEPPVGGYMQSVNAIDGLTCKGLSHGVYLSASGAGTYVNGLNFSNLSLTSFGADNLAFNANGGALEIFKNTFTNVQIEAALSVTGISYLGSDYIGENVITNGVIWDNANPVSNTNTQAVGNSFSGSMDYYPTDPGNLYDITVSTIALPVKRSIQGPIILGNDAAVSPQFTIDGTANQGINIKTSSAGAWAAPIAVGSINAYDYTNTLEGSTSFYDARVYGLGSGYQVSVRNNSGTMIPALSIDYNGNIGFGSHSFNSTTGLVTGNPCYITAAGALVGCSGGSTFITSLTTTGSSGPATVTSGVLNIPQYAGGGSMTWPSGGAGIPNYSGSSSWGTTYSASNPIPANFLTLSGLCPLTGCTFTGALTGTSASFSGTVAAGTTTPTTIGSNGVLLNGVPALQAQTSLNNYYSGGAGNLTGPGNDNTANGLNALSANTTGSGNTANGFQALFSNTTGYSNTANGYEALYYNTTGSNNTANGLKAGQYIADGVTANQTSSNSVYEGFQAYPLASGDTNENVIGNTAIGHGSNTTTLGNSSTIGTWKFGTQHVIATAPTASAGSVAAYSTNAGGEITGLSAATSVTITFANSGWTNAAFCTATPSTTLATVVYNSAQSNTAVTFTFPALTGNLFYHCDGN